jgi:hypothetical protein
VRLKAVIAPNKKKSAQNFKSRYSAAEGKIIPAQKEFGLHCKRSLVCTVKDVLIQFLG